MALILIKEDGSGKADANSYAEVAEANAYFEGHLYASAWTAATPESKAAALVMATRLIDSQYRFNGRRTNETQALQWPRQSCREWGLPGAEWVPDNEVPVPVVQATCEMARELLIADRTAPPPGEGVLSTRTSHYSSDAAGSSSETTSTAYSKADTRPIISPVAQAMLSKYGALVNGRSGVVRLVRS